MPKRILRSLGVLAALSFSALLAAPAQAQFSTPYDPDFPQEQPAPQKPKIQAPSSEQLGELTPEAAPETTPEAPLFPPSAGPFLLYDRPDPAHVFEQPPSASTEPAKPHDFVEFLENLRPFEYTQEKWNKARKCREEGGCNPEAPPPPELIGFGMAISTAAPKAPPPEIELPTYGTSLSVTGRKVISITYNEKKFIHPQVTSGRPQSTNLFDIEQQLQLRMQGKVGPKITVNVDYDDTKQNHQDISVVYTGDPDEVVQNVSFGDIDLSLPPTEFVSYNKQLFGIRADIKYKGLKSSFVGSRTKGTTKTKQFFGNQQFVSQDIADTGYLRRQYYDLTFGFSQRLPLRAGSEKVFLSQNIVTQQNTNTASMVAEEMVLNTARSTGPFTGIFQQLNPGQDYTIDYVHGFIKFNNALQPQFVVAIDFIDSSGSQISVEKSTGSMATGRLDGLNRDNQCREPAFTSGNLPSEPSNNPCPILIKTPSDLPFVSTGTEVGFNRELKTFYSLGQTSIVPDNGRGNFILKVLDQNRTDVGAALNPSQTYPQTINVDFSNGIFNLLSPFAVPGDSSTVDPDIYAVTPIAKRILHAEFSYRFKTFFLEPNLVAQSEIVLLNNQKLNRNVDYFIDYDAGFITFFNPDRITANAEIDISYEVAPFAGITNTSLLGSRVSYDFNKHYTLGATVLYQAGTKSPTTPTITELAQSLLVFDVDNKIQDVQLGKKFKIKMAAAEVAQSRQDLNLNAFAIIDNMEGVRVEDSVSLLSTAWFPASNPSGVPMNIGHLSWLTQDVLSHIINPNTQGASNQSQKVLTLNYQNLSPNDAGHGNKAEEVSLVFPFSISGIDFSQRTILEIVMAGDSSGNQIDFHLGSVNEDADGTGGITLRCASGQTIFNAPKTEDLQCTGILQPGEDVGWSFAPNDCFQGPPCPTSAIGAGNGKIDTEDLNGNGRMDAQDGSGSDFGYLGPIAANGTDQRQLFDVTDANQPAALSKTTIDWGNGNPAETGSWHTLQIPLNISSATISQWTNIRQLRVSIRAKAGATRGLAGSAQTGSISFARIGIVGNTWKAGQATDPSVNSNPVGPENLTVTPINNVNNPNYSPIFNAGGEAGQVFTDLYGSVGQQQQLANSSNISEQALQLSFASMTVVAGQGAVVTTQRLFSKAIDISQHRFFNFLVYGNANTAANNVDPAVADQSKKPRHTFFLRAGDDANFFEVQVPLNFTGWKKIRVQQIDSRSNAVADTWRADTPGTVVVSSGIPNLQSVAKLTAGVRRNSVAASGTPDNQQTAQTVWLDEIHLAQPLPRVGNARKAEVNFEIPGWATFGGKYREVDRNFQTPTSVLSNQDSRQDTGFLNYTRISYFPMSFNVSRSITDTPQTAQTGQLSNLVNLLQQGKVTTWTGSASGNFSRGALPRLNLSYTRNYIAYDLLTRTDDRNTYNGTFAYGVPLKTRFVPKTIDANYSYSRYDVRFGSLLAQSTPGNFNTSEYTQTLGTRLTFVPWTGSSFNPTYSLTKVYEHRDDNTGLASGQPEVQLRYSKSMHETVNVASNYRLLSWLNPQVNYSVDILESNILNVSTFIVNASTFVFNVGDVKTVTRNANGSVSLPLTIGDIFHKSRLFHSLNIVSGYQLQDGDAWNQVEKDLSTEGALWVRQTLHPKGPAAQLQNQTLRDTYNSTQRWSPLESYNIKGRPAAFKTLSISNNFVQSIQRQNVTGTQSKTISTTFPDLVASIGQLEKLWYTERWMANTQMNFRYAAHRVLNIGQTLNNDFSFGTDLRTIVVRRFDSLVSGNIRQSTNENLLVEANTQKTAHQDATVQTTFDIRKFRFTPKTDYSHDASELGTGVKTQDLTVITPSMLVRADLALPRGLLLPGTTKPILFSNRIIWTTTLSLALRSSPVTQADNFKLATFNTSADYELAKNLRMTLNGALSREWHKFLPEEDFISYSFGTTLTFQF